MLGKVPGWITRNGTILFLFLLALLLFGSWVFRYPDINRARITVTSVNPPANMEARTTGKIAGLFVTDNEVVTEGKVLAMIENPADYEAVQLLKSSLGILDTVPFDELDTEIAELKQVRLGTLQSDYSFFMKVYSDYLEFKRIDYHQRKIETARSELDKQQEYTRSLSARAEIQEQAYDLAMRRFNRDASLFEEEVISSSDLEESRSEMLVERNKRQEIISLMAENNINIARTENQIVDLELKQQEEASGILSSLQESYENMKAAITAWEQSYLLVAPVSGSVTFTRFWSENQNVKSGDKVMTIVPAESGSMLGKIDLPLEGAGKVSIGDQVNIQFDNYPYLEYGMVKGEVKNISGVPDGNFYTVEVELSNGLHTYYDRDIPFSQNMQGNVEILTDKKRMITRVLNPIRSALSRQKQI